MTLSDKILVFVHYCLPELGYKFNYRTLRRILREYSHAEYTIGSLRKTMSYLRRDNLVFDRKYYSKKIPALTRKGKLKITPFLPYKKFGFWDGKWRVVIYKIPPKDSKEKWIFQGELERLSFKKIQNGVFISPHPLLPTLSRLATELGIRQHIFLIEADKLDREQWEIPKIWDLESINARYKRFIEKAKRTSRGKFWVLTAKELEEEFTKIYQKDPCLPPEFLPKGWLGEDAYWIYREIVNSY